MYRITTQRISAEALIKAVKDTRAGAISVFIGTVRGRSDGKRVLRLEYEAHEGMAEKALKGIEAEALKRFPITKAVVVHRVGRVNTGETSVGVAVSAPHRDEAFRACRYCIDRVKVVVPLWKKEVYPRGERWVGGRHYLGKAARGMRK